MYSCCSTKFGFQIILYAALAIENTVSVRGILGLKALTGDVPYLGYGNSWITYPRIAYGEANLYSPYLLWRYNRGFWNGYGNRGRISGGYGSTDGIFGGHSNTGYIPDGYGNAGIYYPYSQYSYDLPSTGNSLTIPPRIPYSLTIAPRSSSSNSGRYYRGTGNPWITQQ